MKNFAQSYIFILLGCVLTNCIVYDARQGHERFDSYRYVPDMPNTLLSGDSQDVIAAEPMADSSYTPASNSASLPQFHSPEVPVPTPMADISYTPASTSPSLAPRVPPPYSPKVYIPKPMTLMPSAPAINSPSLTPGIPLPVSPPTADEVPVPDDALRFKARYSK